MANPLPPSVPEIPGASQTKTLYFEAGSLNCFLVEYAGKRRHTTPMPFHDPHAALVWCETNKTNFAFWYQQPPGDPKHN